MPILALDLTLIALIPPIVFSLFWFGIQAFTIFCVCILTCLLTSAFLNFQTKQSELIRKSSLVTAILLAMTLRADTPLIFVVLGGVVAETIGRYRLPSLGRNPFNPAVLGRTAIAIIEYFYPWYDRFTTSEPAVDFSSGATVLFTSQGGIVRPDLTDSILGIVPGSLGETSFVILGLISLFMFRFVLVKWEGPLCMILLTPVLVLLVPQHASVAGHSPWISNSVLFMTGGSLFLAATFFLGDPNTTPKTRKGQILAGTLMALAATLGKITFGINSMEMWVLLLINVLVEPIDNLFKNDRHAESTGNTKIHNSRISHARGNSLSMNRIESEAFLVLKQVLNSNINDVLNQLRQMPFGGRGGSQFPAIKKWDMLRAQSGEPVLIVNAQEGEPDTFKDRFILSQHPLCAAEGILICAHLLKIKEVILVVEQDFEDGGKDIVQAVHGFDLVSIKLVVGPGSYIAGEESALIQFLMNKAPLPVPRPPLPMQSGLYGRPTLVHNLESLTWIPVMLKAPHLWGRGRFLATICGAVRNPGIREIEVGESLQEILEKENFLNDLQVTALQIGGVSGAYLPLNDNPLILDNSFLKSMGASLGTGTIRLIREGDCLVEDLIRQVRFIADSSCHQCSSCRIGTSGLFQSITLLSTGKLTNKAYQLMLQKLEVMQVSSLCGLGRLAGHPFESIKRHFPEEVDFHLKGNHIRACLRKKNADRSEHKANRLQNRSKSITGPERTRLKSPKPMLITKS